MYGIKEMKEHAKLQLQEFYNARSKLLDNLPKIEPKESMESGVQGTSGFFDDRPLF